MIEKVFYWIKTLFKNDLGLFIIVFISVLFAMLVALNQTGALCNESIIVPEGESFTCPKGLKAEPGKIGNKELILCKCKNE